MQPMVGLQDPILRNHGLSLRDGARSREFLGYMRHVDQAPYGAAEHALLSQLMPRLQQANRLRYRAMDLALQANLGVAALDALPQALALVDITCRLRYANASARTSLGTLRGIGLQGDRLACKDDALQATLVHHVTQACGCAGSTRAGALRLPPGEAGPGPCLYVLPLQPNHALSQTYGVLPHALLVWTTPCSLLLHAHQIATALGLTETEARLALALAQGQSVKDFALAQGCTWHTARTHAKNLLCKTGSHKQAEVVDLVRAMMWRS